MVCRCRIHHYRSTPEYGRVNFEHCGIHHSLEHTFPVRSTFVRPKSTHFARTPIDIHLHSLQVELASQSSSFAHIPTSFDLRTTQVEHRRPTLALSDTLHSLVNLRSPYVRSLQVDPSRTRLTVAIARTSSPMSFVLRLLVRIYPIFDSIYL
jgi:hypothetical protein